MDIITAIKKRISTRSYSENIVDSAKIEQLINFAKKTKHLTIVPPRIELVSGVDKTNHILTSIIGSYGLVRNPPHLLIGITPEESDIARIDLGYVLEHVVLEATKLGLSTCWISGSYNPKIAEDEVKTKSGEAVEAVCALGYPAEEMLECVHSKIVRRIASSHHRKPLKEIVFYEHWAKPWSQSEEDPVVVTILEHARLAPSGANRQPWRFIIKPESIVLALVLTKPLETGIVNMLSPIVGVVKRNVLVKAQYIDAGIVMSHFTLVSEAIGRTGQWELRLGDKNLAKECQLLKGIIPVAIFNYKS
ncbi:MAG: nitroreductase family protein [Actinobacteria bacterium]|nr:nitroreductase family protein [Actinomycetota bacterium]